MKQTQATDMFMAGQPVLCLELRKSTAECVKYRDKASKQIMELNLLRHACEAADGTPFIVNERTPDTFKAADYKPTFKKGDKVILRFSSMTTERGQTSFNGTLEKVEA